MSPGALSPQQAEHAVNHSITWSDSSGTFTIDPTQQYGTWTGDFPAIRQEELTAEHNIEHPVWSPDPETVERFIQEELGRRVAEELDSQIMWGMRTYPQQDEPPGLLRSPQEPSAPERQWRARTRKLVRRIRL